MNFYFVVGDDQISIVAYGRKDSTLYEALNKRMKKGSIVECPKSVYHLLKAGEIQSVFDGQLGRAMGQDFIYGCVKADSAWA